jgi:hypothetical protein
MSSKPNRLGDSQTGHESLRLGIRKEGRQKIQLHGQARGTYGVLALVVVSFMLLAIALVYIVLSHGRS